MDGSRGQPDGERQSLRLPQEVGEGVFGRLLSVFDDFAATPAEILADGNRVVAFGRYTAIHRDSGEALDAQFAHSWTLDDGKIVAFQQYTDTEQHVRLMG